MIKKEITFVDFDGNEVTEDFRFNLTKMEWMRLEASFGGLVEYLSSVVKENDSIKMMDFLEKFIQTAYGEKDEDGRFVKSEARSNAFSQTEAYSELILGLLNNAEDAQQFIMGVIPADMRPTGDELAKAKADAAALMPR